MLSEDQHSALRRVGRSLAKQTGRYGEPVAESKASLVHLERLEGGSTRVKVVNAVGMIAVEGLQLTVLPKIPQGHFLEIVSRSSRLPDVSTLPGTLRAETDFIVLVCQWFLIALERILAEGLLRDYREIRDETTAVRGRIEPLGTARLFYRGRLAVAARFEEFDYDTPLNRILVAAARVIAGAPLLPAHLRRRAMRGLRQMAGVSTLAPTDLAAEVDRASAHYADGVLLAKEVIAASGRSLLGGQAKSWTFLYRTAIPVEEGIRAILAEGCGPTPVRKKSFPLGETSMRANPDLVFGDVLAVGDVKYKLGTGAWDRPDLYEVVAFAAAANVSKAILVDFRSEGVPPLSPVSFDEIDVFNASWPALTSLTAESAREALVAEVIGSLT